jgi:hypothetical protein
VGFTDPDAVGKFLDGLKTGGLTFLRDGKCIDIAVIDQQQGPTRPCDWIECARVPFGNTGGKVSMCWLFDEPRVAAGTHLKSLQMKLATPVGWVFEGSLSDKFTFVPTEEVASRLKYLRTEKKRCRRFPRYINRPGSVHITQCCYPLKPWTRVANSRRCRSLDGLPHSTGRALMS